MKHILIVDDAVTVRMYHRQLVESMGYQAEEAENGIEALEKGMTINFDLFLVDVNMPKMDGYRLVQEMRQLEELQSIPVVMVSTEEDELDKEKAYIAGANFYLVKPVKPDELKSMVALLVGEAE